MLCKDKDVNNEASDLEDFNRIGDLYHSTILMWPLLSDGASTLSRSITGYSCWSPNACSVGQAESFSPSPNRSSIPSFSNGHLSLLCTISSPQRGHSSLLLLLLDTSPLSPA